MGLNQISVYGLLHLSLERWRRHEQWRVAAKLDLHRRPTVLYGPFSGLQFPSGIDVRNNLPKIIGSYECELNSIIEELILRRFPLVVNVGCAEGYYAIGLAMRNAQSSVFAFDIDPEQQERCRRMARLNGVDGRVQVSGKCDAATLVRLKLEDALVLMDCEGAELEILAEEVVPSLLRTHLLIELHDAVRPGCSRTLWQRFSRTHEMVFIAASARDPGQYPILQRLSPRKRHIAVHEDRLGVQEWVFMRPLPSKPASAASWQTRGKASA